MPTTTVFEMKIIEVFHFADGRTIMVGPVGIDTPFIEPCGCQLLVNGIPQGSLKIEGEMIPDRTHDAGYRVVSTHCVVQLDRELVQQGDCRLIGERNNASSC